MLTTLSGHPKQNKNAHRLLQPGAKLQCGAEKYRDTTAVPRRNLQSV